MRTAVVVLPRLDAVANHLVFIVVFLCIGLYREHKQKRSLEKKLRETEDKLEVLQKMEREPRGDADPKD